MIPYRITLAGFLSYRAPQTLRFSESSLWMLSGANGSGKSAVFDALTFALFGYHRGGGSQAEELINKDSHDLLVEFDFLHEGRLYRIKRTLRRTKSGKTTPSQQLFALPLGADPDSESWEAIPDTNKKIDFDRWIKSHIALNYETFTSSVLLLQGKAEKLLDAKPSGRFSILAGILDLERYQKLHERANRRKLDLKSKADALATQLEALPDIPEEHLASAEEAIAFAHEAGLQAQATLEAALSREQQAQQWRAAQERVQLKQDQLKQAEILIARSADIERDFRRWSELDRVIPSVVSITRKRADARAAEQKLEKLTEARSAQRERRSILSQERELKAKEREEHIRQLERNDARLHDLTLRLRELTGIVSRLADLDRLKAQQDEVQRQFATLPPVTVSREAVLQEIAALQDLDRVLPILERFQIERHDLVTAYRELGEAENQRDTIRAEGEKAKAQLLQKEAVAREARARLAQAEKDRTIQQTLTQQAEAALTELTAQDQDSQCRSCGQPLTPGHIKEERKKRTAEWKQAQKELAKREKELTEVQSQTTLALNEETEALALVTKLRDEYRDALARHKSLSTTIDQLTKALDLKYAEMLEPFRSRIAPTRPERWTTTTYPERDQLAQLRREVETLPARRRVLDQIEREDQARRDLSTKRDLLQAQIMQATQELPPGDAAALREEFTRLHAEEKPLRATIQTTKRVKENLDREMDQLSLDIHKAEQELTRLTGEVNTETQRLQSFQELTQQALSGLPELWKPLVEKAGLEQLHAWKGEWQQLQDARVPENYERLGTARAGLTAIREDLQTLELEERRYPAEVRVPLESLREQIQQARAQRETAEENIRRAVNARDQLSRDRARRAELAQQYREFSAEHQRYKVLAELLSRDRLQLRLIRTAEQQIVHYANAVLDRLSGGELYLRIVEQADGSSSEDALDIECLNRRTGSAGINVTFLSGSQKFRVAVSMALAIGQYASRRSRPIESVIIDEGFGCLDRNGRQVMIQELHNLSDHLRCILLVSHQEEFADAFAEGYRFQLQNGSTEVQRITA